MGETVKRYRDAYGQYATAIKDTYGPGWKLTFRRRGESYTRHCRSYQQIARILDANGYEWTEVG